MEIGFKKAATFRIFWYLFINPILTSTVFSLTERPVASFDIAFSLWLLSDRFIYWFCCVYIVCYKVENCLETSASAYNSTLSLWAYCSTTSTEEGRQPTMRIEERAVWLARQCSAGNIWFTCKWYNCPSAWWCIVFGWRNRVLHGANIGAALHSRTYSTIARWREP